MTLFKRMIEKTEMVRHMCRTRFLVVFKRILYSSAVSQEVQGRFLSI